MARKKDEKYWKDYNKFRSEVWKLTNLSPTHLLESYKEIIEQCEDIKYADKDSFITWQYEVDNEIQTREEIQRILDDKSISENILLIDFKKKIEELDSELKKYVIYSEQNDWWKNIRLKDNIRN